jgi:hypothetical protein
MAYKAQESEVIRVYMPLYINFLIMHMIRNVRYAFNEPIHSSIEGYFVYDVTIQYPLAVCVWCRLQSDSRTNMERHTSALSFY